MVSRPYVPIVLAPEVVPRSTSEQEDGKAADDSSHLGDRAGNNRKGCQVAAQIAEASVASRWPHRAPRDFFTGRSEDCERTHYCFWRTKTKNIFLEASRPPDPRSGEQSRRLSGDGEGAVCEAEK